MIFSTFSFKPPRDSTINWKSVPTGTSTLQGVFKPSPVRVMTVEIKGRSYLIASLIARTVATLSTIQPTSRGSIFELSLLPVNASINILSPPCGYLVFNTLTLILSSCAHSFSNV